jgi:hypothetical protein
VFFFEGRIAFEGGDYKPTQQSPFGNMVVLFGADEAMIERMLRNFDCVHLPRRAAVGRRQERDSAVMRIAAE